MQELRIKQGDYSVLWLAGGGEGMEAKMETMMMGYIGTLRVQVPNIRILTPNLYYDHYYQYSKYLNIGYMDP